jgi:hypothetical protein
VARRLYDLVDLGRQDAERQQREADRQQRHHGRFWLQFAVWGKRFEDIADWAKKLGLLVTGLTTLLTGGWGAYKLVRKVGQIYAATKLAPADQPVTDHGIASTTVDRVPLPKPPPR